MAADMLANMVNAFKLLLEERERWVLWLPVFMGAGIAVYFAWPNEPPLYMSVLLCVAWAIAAWFLRGGMLAYAAMIFFMMTFGHLAAGVETANMQQPMLKAEQKDVFVSGRVMVLNRLPDGYRLWLEDAQIEGITKTETPRTIRIKIRYQDEMPSPGSWVSVRAALYPLSRPAEPEAFDFRRFAFFQGFGATGFSLGKWRYAEGPPPSFAQKTVLFFERVRVSIAENLFKHGAARETAVASALITGDQSSIDKGTMQAMRVSGISHILSVSGLHITLVAGLVFYVLRALMAIIPYVRLHWPIKKIAAVAALFTAAFYTFMCAAPVPAVRSMLMSGLILIAIMVDRRALSMRLVAFAAFVGLLFAPSSLFDPSFQLSFGAVMALIAVFEKKEHGLWLRFESEGWLGKAGMYLAGSVATSLVATLATMPFILYHFQQINWYGVLTNLIAVPLSSFIIMPAAVVAVVLMPFGCEHPAMWVMRTGIQWMIDSATWVSLWPGAATYHPAMNAAWLLLSIFGGLWFCLWKQRWRYLGILPFVIGTCGFLFVVRPDVFVAEGAMTVAVRDTDGKLIARAIDKDDFDLRVWKQRDGHQGDGMDYFANWMDAAEKDGQGALSCQGVDCVYNAKGVRVSFPLTTGAVCDAPIAIGPHAGELCKGAAIDKTTSGAHTLFFENGDLVVKNTAAPGHRPWN